MLSETEARLNRDFLREYSSEASIRKYTKNTAGNGISYLLDHDYRDIYLDFPSLTFVMRTLTPLLNAVAPSHAMRSLVVFRKNGHRSNEV